jgi:hypothetical protein
MGVWGYGGFYSDLKDQAGSMGRSWVDSFETVLSIVSVYIMPWINKRRRNTMNKTEMYKREFQKEAIPGINLNGRQRPVTRYAETGESLCLSKGGKEVFCNGPLHPSWYRENRMLGSGSSGFSMVQMFHD